MVKTFFAKPKNIIMKKCNAFFHFAMFFITKNITKIKCYVFCDVFCFQYHYTKYFSKIFIFAIDIVLMQVYNNYKLAVWEV